LTIPALDGRKSFVDDDARKQRDQIVRALTASKGRVGGVDGAAARLKVQRTTLLSRMKKLGINVKQFA
jgi:formate hydrogenlyase transcriptional activator